MSAEEKKVGPRWVRLMEAADVVTGELNHVGGYKLDPMTVAALIAALVLLLKKCEPDNPEHALRRVQPNNLRRLDRWRLRRAIKERGLEADEEAVEAALLDCAESISAQDLAELYDEVAEVD